MGGAGDCSIDAGNKLRRLDDWLFCHDDWLEVFVYLLYCLFDGRIIDRLFQLERVFIACGRPELLIGPRVATGDFGRRDGVFILGGFRCRDVRASDGGAAKLQRVSNPGDAAEQACGRGRL